ncbi:WhiB family transcriptional regulator [Nonomuraea sp. SBT364]|uniref:WhiB family transcriptional regulator n=1 Tax=Nonomuraea sp. SBT364 TaxID=1580530 RepID=UPI00066EF66D|nr:WhiB family transcriptional regulator [Nonomuraea sp. SBT364]
MTSWEKRAACRDMPTETFFLIAYSTRLPEVKAAKNICRECPVLRDCLDWALRAGEPDGIWGGLTPSERRRARTTNPHADDGRTAAA